MTAGARRRARERAGNAPPWQFVARLAGCWAAGFLLVAFVPAVDRVVNEATAACVPVTVGGLFPDLVRSGALLSGAGPTIRIVPECTSLTPTILLCGAIAAYPGAVALKLAGFVAASAILWIFNLGRIAVLLVVLDRWPAHFDFIHVYLWQSVSFLVVAGLFMLWLRLLETRTPG